MLIDSSELEEGREPQDLVFAVDRATATDGAYPIALVSYLIGCVEYEDTAKAQLVKDYFTFVASEEGQQIAADEAGSAPISESLREQVNTAIEAIVTERPAPAGIVPSDGRRPRSPRVRSAPREHAP